MKEIVCDILEGKGTSFGSMDEEACSKYESEDGSVSVERIPNDSLGVCSPISEGTFFGVHLPPELEKPSRDSRVFTVKAEALQFLRKFKQGRLKAFATEEEAVRFAEQGLESVTISETPQQSGLEKSPFKSLKPQDMVKFRKTIESGNLEVVKALILENPRYLVSSGDTPAIVQEGSRYNSLHIAAKSGHSAICDHILETVSSPHFIKRLYGDLTDTLENVEDRCKVLLDLYLNTPDKALNETPLHFASKMGALAVVACLVSYSQCDKNRRNKFGNTPYEIACSRSKTNDTNIKKEITDLLGEQYYVPVLRAEDCSLQAVVGEPFPVCSPPPPPIRSPSLEPQLEVKALAGPMDLDSAVAFRKKWKKTPPRRQSPGRSILRRPTLYDPDKGLECVGRELARDEKVYWSEYWSFLETFTDLKTEEGLEMLEEYLLNRFKEVSSYSSDGWSNNTPNHRVTFENDKASNLSKRSTSENEKSCSNESDQVLSPLSDLCLSLKKLNLSDESPTNCEKQQKNVWPDSAEVLKQQSNMDKLCQVYAKKLVDALLKPTSRDKRFDNVRNAGTHIHSCLGNCKEDERFNCIPISKAHSRVARMCCRQLCDPEDRKTALEGLNDVLEMESFCLFSTLRKYLTGTPNEKFEPDLPTWDSENACGCNFMLSLKGKRHCYHYRPRRNFLLDLWNCEREEGISACQNMPNGGDENLEDSDSSEADSDMFMTPPTSPTFESEDSDSDCEMFLPDEGPDVYIVGEKPSKLDAAVLEAISDVDLKPNKYPNICRWKHLVSLTSRVSSKESWPSPSLRELEKRKNRDESLRLTPSWHRSRLLTYE